MTHIEGLSYEERDIKASQTRLPGHKTSLWYSMASRLFNPENRSAVGTMCDADYPVNVQETADHGLMSECGGCHGVFVWVDRTQSWCQS